MASQNAFLETSREIAKVGITCKVQKAKKKKHFQGLMMLYFFFLVNFQNFAKILTAQNTMQLRCFMKSLVYFNKEDDVANVFHSNHNLTWQVL